MTDAGAASDDLPPAQGDLPPGPAVDPAAALAQMAGLALSRETVDTALELVTSLAARWSSRPTPCSTNWTTDRA
jgi:hypothetical protein